MPMPNNFWWVAGAAAAGTIIGGLCLALWSLMTRPTADLLEVLGRVAGRAMIGACIGWALALVLAMVQWLHFYNLPLKPEGWAATFSNVFVASTVLSMVLFVIAVVAGLPVIVSGGAVLARQRYDDFRSDRKLSQMVKRASRRRDERN